MIGRLRLIFVVFVVGGPLAAAVWWYRTRPPELPLLPQAVVDPEIARAIEKARDEVLRKPESGPARGALGMVLLAHEYPDAAAAYLEQAARMEPKEPSWPYFLAMTRQADPEAAIEWLKRSADLADRATLVPRTVLGEVYLQQGRLDEAEEAFKFVNGRWPDNRRARLGLARVSVARGQLDSAVTLLERMSKEQPTRKDVLSLLAQVHSRRNALETAEAVRTRAAALPDDPAWPDPFRNMLLNITVGKLFRIHKLAELNQAGRQQEATFLSRELMNSHPDLASSAEARWERSQGNFTAAESAYRKTIELTPSSSEARFELAEMLREQQKYAAAATELRLLLERDPTHGPASYALGLCAQKKGDRKEAIRALRAAVVLMPSNAAAHRDLGIVLREAGDEKEALRHLRLAVHLDGKDSRAREMLEAIEKGKKP